MERRIVCLDLLDTAIPNGIFGFSGWKKDCLINISRELKVRAKFAPTMDLYRAHECLKRDIRKMKKIPPAWRWMAKFARRILEDCQDWLDPKMAEKYIRNEQKLGSKKKWNGSTFLVELSPVPAPSIRRARWTQIYGKRLKENREDLIKKRIKELRGIIAVYKPKYLFAYGETYWKHYCKIARLKESEFENVNGTKGRAKVGCISKTTVVLLPFLNNRRFGIKNAKKIMSRLLQ